MENNVTIMKYRIGEKYFFKVMDRFDIADEADRLDEMILTSKQIEAEAKARGEEFELLWIKNTPVI